MLNVPPAIGLIILLAAGAAPSRVAAPSPTAAAAGQNTPTRPEASVPDFIPPYRELEPRVRAELPELELTMIRYDSNPEHRFVILNGRRITEGLPAGRDLWVHEVRRKHVVMKYIDRYFLLRPR